VSIPLYLMTKQKLGASFIRNNVSTRGHFPNQFE
jgi:hypothetical protein